VSVLRRTQSRSADPAAAASTTSPPSATSTQSPVDGLSTPLTARPPSTRTSATWVGICAAVVGFVVLIVFMLQNTGSVDIRFLWMNGSLPLALALFVAAVGTALLTAMVGAARMSQLRRFIRHHSD
jgi:uncharacterized integral membrane protein